MNGSTTVRERTGVRIWIGWVALALALGFNLWTTTRHWTSRALIGHEFRQAQTALITHWIDRRNDFSLHYETPIFGKPWSVPLEFPLYEWLVVGLKRVGGVSDVVAARTLSLASFYAMLPALWLVLGDVGVARRGRAVILALVLVVPVHLFYARAFLIDPLATAASAWFLAAFGRSLARGDRRWMLACTVAGTVAALIKSVVFFVWLVPAAIWGAIKLAQAGWARDGGRIRATLFRGLTPTILPAVSLWWWVRFTDAIKAGHPSGYIFTSRNLSVGNFGTFSLEARLDPATWSALFDGWRQAVIGPGWAVSLLVVGWLGAGRWRWHLTGAFGLFLVGQLAFPYAWAYQDYYFYAGATFLAVALGFGALGWLDRERVPAWCQVLAVAVPLGLLAANYRTGYQRQLEVDQSRDWIVYRVLREMTPEDSVFVGAGADWSAITAYFSQRRALMIRNGLEFDGAYLAEAFCDLDDEEVSALLVWGPLREHQRLIQLAQRQFDLDGAPTLRTGELDLYLKRDLRDGVLARLRAEYGAMGGLVELASGPATIAGGDEPGWHELTPAAAARRFGLIDGCVQAFSSPFGSELTAMTGAAGAPVLRVDAPTRLLVEPPARSGRFAWTLRVMTEAYAGREPWEGTDGVLACVRAVTADGGERVLARRFLDPLRRAEDRGEQLLEGNYALGAGERLQLEVTGGFGNAYDWTEMAGFRFRTEGRQESGTGE